MAKMAQMAKMKSRPKILILYNDLGDYLASLKK
jgi:hypothetical protein